MTENLASKPAPRTITMERTYQAPIEDVWELWTTKQGLESWWGPEGFAVTVAKLDLRPGGVLDYAMSAVDPDTVAFMKKAGMPATTQHRLTFTEVTPQRRLAYQSVADFIPEVAPYHLTTEVELHPIPGGVRMVLRFDAMHDELWTQRATAGHESELGKLAKVLARR